MNRNTELAERLSATLEEKRGSLVGFIRSKVESAEVAEDILHDVLYQLLRSADASEAIEDVTAWIYHAARNRIVDWYRKRKTEQLPEHARSNRSPEADTMQSLQWEAFVDALAELPPKQRDVFVRHEMDGMSFEEIARETGENINTLLSRKRYAVLALRKMLAPYQDDWRG